MSRYFAFVGASDHERSTLIRKVNAHLTEKGYSIAILKQGNDLGPIQESMRNYRNYEDLPSELVAFVTPEASDVVLSSKDQEVRVFQLAEDTTDYILLDGFETLPDVPKVVICGGNEPEERGRTDIVAIIGTHEKTRAHPLYKSETELPSIVETLALPPNLKLNCGKCGFPNCEAFRAMILQGKKVVSDCVAYGSPVRICINNKDIALVPFIQKLIESIITGMIRTLHTPDEAIRTIQITIDRPEGISEQ